MKCFIPVSDEMLFNPGLLRRYRLVPYNADFKRLRPGPPQPESPSAAGNDTATPTPAKRTRGHENV